MDRGRARPSPQWRYVILVIPLAAILLSYVPVSPSVVLEFDRRAQLQYYGSCRQGTAVGVRIAYKYPAKPSVSVRSIDDCPATNCGTVCRSMRGMPTVRSRCILGPPFRCCFTSLCFWVQTHSIVEVQRGGAGLCISGTGSLPGARLERCRTTTA